MRMIDLIAKKRDGLPLEKEEIDFIIKGFTCGEIPDYQMSSLLMAIYFNKMNEEETINLTMSMRDSGDILDLSSIKGIKVDKHSTGGVGDKTTLVLMPMVAALNIPCAKMSGRGLGHTGGTIDKMESIPGFTTSLSLDEFTKQVNEIGLAITGQTGNLAPADKKIYALRDASATVENISLIASSIMSKKLASGADAICLDVKVGSGAFMKTMEDATKLAKLMVKIGNSLNKKTIAVISEMDEPLGMAVGNSLEIIEVIEALKGRGPKDLMELVMCLGTQMCKCAGLNKSDNEIKRMLEESIANGSALNKFREFLNAQDGNVDVINDYSILPTAKSKYEVKSVKEGCIKHIKADVIGHASMILGGGREKKEDSIDFGVGVVLNKKRGDYCKKGELLATVYVNDEKNKEQALSEVLSAFTIVNHEVLKESMIKKIIE